MRTASRDKKDSLKTGLEKMNKLFPGLTQSVKFNMAEENGVEDINGKTEELALENGECDEDERGAFFK